MRLILYLFNRLTEYLHIVLLVLSASILSCKESIDTSVEEVGKSEEILIVNVPHHFDGIPVDSTNPITLEKVKLGKELFNDPALSLDGSVSCASCHHISYAFSDTVALSKGIYGQMSKRNSTPLFNLAYHPYFFRDGGTPTLEMQVVVPIENELEMGHNMVALAEQLDGNKYYHDRMMEIYNLPVSAYTITRSIGAYLRTLISANSAYDQYIVGDKNALSSEELAGLNLFMGKANCVACHEGFNFTSYALENNGLYEIYIDSGKFHNTTLIEDIGKFKVPSLRNVALTAPYMHDGSINSLTKVIEHYNQGGKNHANKSEKIVPLNLSAQEKEQLEAFLKTLTDNNIEQY